MPKRMSILARTLLPVAAVAALVVLPSSPAHAVCYTDEGGDSFDSKTVSNDAGTATIRVRTNAFWIVCGPPPAGASYTTALDRIVGSYVIVSNTDGNLKKVHWNCMIYRADSPVDTTYGTVYPADPDNVVRMQPAIGDTYQTRAMHYDCTVRVYWGNYNAGDDVFHLTGWQNG